MDLNNLERGELQNLQNQETDFDQSAMWENIDPAKKKRRPFLWFWFGGAGMILLLAGLFFYNFQNENSILTASKNTDSLPLIITKSSTINSERTSTQVNKKQPSLSKTKIIITKNLTSEKSPIAKDKVEKIISVSSKDTPKNIEQNNPSTIPPSFLIESKKLKTTPNEIDKLVEKSTKTSNKKSTTTRLASLPRLPQLRLISPKLNLKTNLKLKAPEAKIEIAFKEDALDKSPIIPVEKPKFILSAFAGIGYQFKTLELGHPEASLPQLTKRNNSESVMESLAFGFEIDKNIAKKWTIGSGVEYILHTEKMQLENRTIANIADIEPAEIPAQYQDREGYLIRFKNSVYYNQHRLFNLPLRASYQINYKKIRFFPELGLVLNLSQKSTGHLLNQFSETEPLADQFKNEIGLSYRFGCKVLIPAGRQFSLYAKPSFEWNPNDVSANLNFISQRRNLVRLDLGVSRNF